MKHGTGPSGLRPFMTQVHKSQGTQDFHGTSKICPFSGAQTTRQLKWRFLNYREFLRHLRTWAGVVTNTANYGSRCSNPPCRGFAAPSPPLHKWGFGRSNVGMLCRFSGWYSGQKPSAGPTALCLFMGYALLLRRMPTVRQAMPRMPSRPTGHQSWPVLGRLEVL